MGKKKKFIEKGEGVKFYLVHRSQKDPLYLDESLGEHVLVPADPEDNRGLVQAISGLSLNSTNKTKAEKEELKRKRLEEQHKFGIYYEDDYDYLQHLRDVEQSDKVELEKHEIKVGSVLIKDEDDSDDQQVADNNKSNKSKLNLPSTVFASQYEEDVGYFNQAAPDHDPKIGWDPDIVKILDEDQDIEYNDDLEDDFFVNANKEAPIAEKKSKKYQHHSETNEETDDTYENEEDDDEDDDDDDEEYSDNESDGRFSGSESRSVKEFETKSRFSNYSMTSSVIRRNEGLRQLDEHFEKIFAEYDEDQIGALDTEEIDGFRGNDLVLESALQEFTKLTQKKLYENESRVTKAPKLGVLKEEMSGDEEGEEEEEETDDEEKDEDSTEENETGIERKDNYVVLSYGKKKSKEDRFDCESIVSTYSNLYNRPAIINEKDEAKIKLSKKTGLPLGVLPDKPKSKKELETIDHKITRIVPEIPARKADETKEEKKARKAAIKEHKRERRVEKKINKLAFKTEKANQLKQIGNNLDNVVKLPL